MTLADVGIVLLPNLRSKAFLQNMLKNGLIPGGILLLDTGGSSGSAIPVPAGAAGLFDPNEDVTETLRKNNLSFRPVAAADCNDPAVMEAISAMDQSSLIYCGGGILKKEILSRGKRFIHVHPGTVPRFRGSTCFYYQIITEGKCGATAFFMEEAIDTGNILLQKEYPLPSFADLDRIFDPWMRSDLLIDVLRQYVKEGKFPETPQTKEGAEDYYIIHPVLKNLAIAICAEGD